MLFGKQKIPGPEPRYAIVCSTGESGEPILAMDDVPVDGAGLAASVGVVFSSRDDADAYLVDNELPTRERAAVDGTWYAVQDTKTGELLDR